VDPRRSSRRSEVHHAAGKGRSMIHDGVNGRGDPHQGNRTVAIHHGSAEGANCLRATGLLALASLEPKTGASASPAALWAVIGHFAVLPPFGGGCTIACALSTPGLSLRSILGSALRQAPPQRFVLYLRPLLRPRTTTSWFTTMRGKRCAIGPSDVATSRERYIEGWLACPERRSTAKCPITAQRAAGLASAEPWWIATSLFPFVVDRDVALSIRGESIPPYTLGADPHDRPHRGGSRRPSPHSSWIIAP
jgi:hypothetical protein